MGDFQENLSGNSKFGYNQTNISDTLYKELSTFIYRSTKYLVTQHCRLSIAKLNSFALLKGTCMSTM